MSIRNFSCLGLAVVAGLLVGVVFRQAQGPPAASAQIEFAAERAQCSSGSAVASGNDGLLDDCAVLLGVEATLRGTETLNWDAGLAIGSWEGIRVGGTPSRVTRLHLDSNSTPRQYGRRITLTGTIPPELGRLEKLENLTLARHELTGTIPPELGQLTELTTLSLHGNELSGGIPPELGYLSRLSALYLRNNELEGGIPVELSRLSELSTLDLQGNGLTGSIPAALGDLPELVSLLLGHNALLTGCIPESLRGAASGVDSLGYCTETTTHELTTQATGPGRIGPLAGTYSYLAGESVTVTATPDPGHEVASWRGDCSGSAATCVLTMDAARTASVVFEPLEFTLGVTVTGSGTVTPAGVTTHDWGTEVELRARWSDATHEFTGWGGACSGTGTTCVLTMDAPKSVTATFAELAADRCAEPEDADCIRAVYRGAPSDYAQVVAIPGELLLTPDAEGRYQVARGEQVTVVTAAPLPAGWTRFYLGQTPLGSPSPVSASQLIKPVGTTYMFTPTEDEGGSNLITFDLTAARPFVRPRPDGKPQLGDVVATTVFQVSTCASGVAVPNPSANADLVEDCEHLLALRDTLEGTPTLNWSVGRAITAWTGVTVSGTPMRVTKLELARSGLTGELSGLLGDLDGLTELRLDRNALSGRIPSKLTQLSDLAHLYLGGNTLSGCVPTFPSSVTNNDLATLGLTDCDAPTDVSFGRHTLGEGSYEFTLTDTPLHFDVPQGLRLEIVGLVVSDSDAGGGSGAGLILRDTQGGSWICLDVEGAEECSRWVLDADGGTIEPLLDRIAESLWMGGAP